MAEIQRDYELGPHSVVLATLADQRGGVWRHIEDLAAGLTDAGIDVRIGLRPDAAALRGACQDAGLRWESIDESVRSNVDVWHLHLGDTFSRDALRLLAVRRTAGLSVITEHLPRTLASDPALEPQIPRHRGAYNAKTAFKRAEFVLAARVIAVSLGSAKFLSQRYALAPRKVSVIPNGILVPARQGRRRGPEPSLRLNVAIVGSLIRQKGHDVLLEAARRSSGDWTLTIIGSGAHGASLADQAAALPNGRVRLLGWLDDPHDELAEADVACMPSRWEAFPYAALEAAGMGLPIVATAVDGLADIVVDGLTGLLVPPNDPRALAVALDHLAARPIRELREMGAAGRARVAGCFGLKRMVQETLETYQQATAEVRPDRRYWPWMPATRSGSE